ncbi:MAG: SurA N-terminal domain-containing protein [Muribaculum sp.]|nr:SurA N-terminal domain-containing protein [Muribaculum sp.]
MATLEKIRKRSTLLLVIVGLALLAFIIGDFFTSGRTLFGTGTTIAKVGDEKIDIQEFSRRYEEANQRIQQQNNASRIDPAMLQAEVLNSMVQERLINQEIEALGIEVTNDELSKAMLGASAHPYMYQMARQMGANTPDEVYDLAFNPAKYNVPAETAQQLKALWLQQEEQMLQLLKMQKFQNMLAGALVANELDAKAFYDGNASTSHIAYVKKNYSTMPNDQYEVSSSDIKAQYNKDKNMYKVPQEVRRANYIVVNVAPSVQDKDEAQVLVDSVIVLLQNTPALEAIAGDVNFGVDRQTTTANAINNPLLRTFVTDSVPGSVRQISYVNDEFTVAKLIDSKMAVDSINVDLIAYQGDAAGRDSILRALNSGVAFAEVAAMPGVVNSADNLWQTLAAAPDNEVKERLLNAPAGYFIVDSTANMAQIARVNTKRAPVKVYDYATVSYKVYPSEATIDKLNDDLEAFIGTIQNADSLTMEKAMSAGYTLLPAAITADTYMLGNVPYSRNAVRWVMEAKKGQISPILEDNQNDHLIVVALNDIIEPGFAPLSDSNVLSANTLKARNQKKAADLMANYNGKATDLAGYAQLLSTEVDSTDVTFGQTTIRGIGVEPALIGQAAAAAPNTLSQLVQGDNGVYVFTVIGVDNESRPYNYQEYAARYNQQFGSQAVMQNLINIMMENNKVQNNTLKFYTE